MLQDHQQLLEESEFKREQLEFDCQELVKHKQHLQCELVRLQKELDERDSNEKIRKTNEQESIKQLKLSKQYCEDELERVTNDRGKLRKELDQAKEAIDKLTSEKNTLVVTFETEKSDLAHECDKLKEDHNRLIMDLVKNRKDSHMKAQKDQEVIESLKTELDSLKFYSVESTNNLKHELKQLNSVLLELKKQRDHLEQENFQLKSHFKSYEHEIDTKNNKISQLEECVRMQKKYLYELKHYFEGDLKNETTEVCLPGESRQDTHVQQQHACETYKIIEIPIEKSRTKPTSKVTFHNKLSKFQLLQEQLLKCEQELVEFTQRRKRSRQSLKKTNIFL